MKTIDEIEDKYKADLSNLYKNETALEKDKERIKELVLDITKYKNKVLENSNNLYNVLKLIEEYSLLTLNVYVYYYFKYDLDLTNDSAKEKLELFENYRLSSLKDINFVDIELKKITLDKWNRFKSENSKLKVYDYYFEEILRLKRHNLKPNDEKFLTNLYPILGSESNIYYVLTNADFKANPVLVDGKLEELSENNYYMFLTNKDREVRKNATINMMCFYKEHNHTLSELYKTFIKGENIFSKLYKYKNSFDEEMKENNLPNKVYINLMNIIKKNKKFLDKYYKILKKDFGYKELYSYDILYNKYESKKYSYDEAIVLAKNALSVLGEKYIKIFDEGINSRWIDVYPYMHKNPIQYSVDGYKMVPFIHLNFNENFDDVSTLVHEMGHSINSVLTSNNVDFVYGTPSILVTETIAIVNETLLANYVLNNSKNDEEKLFILIHLLNSIRSTIFFQINIADFEYNACILDSKGEILTSETLNNLWKDISKKYTSATIKSLEDSKYMWARIPHIFQDGGFYVYKYALGLCIASSIAGRILNNDKEFVEKYINFMSMGSSKSDYELFKELDIDITKSDYIDSAFNLFNKYLDEYERLVNKTKK